MLILMILMIIMIMIMIMIMMVTMMVMHGNTVNVNIVDIVDVGTEIEGELPLTRILALTICTCYTDQFSLAMKICSVC